MPNLPEPSLKRLIELLRTQSYEQRPVVLASGRSSNHYIDGKQTTLHAEGLYHASALMLRAIRGSGVAISAVGGPTMGADPLAAGISVLSFLAGPAIPAFLVRKEPKKHGTAAWVEGNKNVPSGSCVALVEDVITTGGSLLKAAARVEEAGLIVSMVLSVVDREEGGIDAIRKAGYHYEPLLTLTDLTALR